MAFSSTVFLLVSSLASDFTQAQSIDDNYKQYGMENIVYHTPSNMSVDDRCSYKDPNFPYAIDKITKRTHVVWTIVHAVLAVWVFVFFIPVSVFPVLYSGIAPTKGLWKYKVKEWMLIHIIFSLPVFPLLTVSIVCAMKTDLEDREMFASSSCSFYDATHAFIGAGCYLIYVFQFGCTVFCFSGLLNDRYKNLRFYHGLSNFFGYLLSIPLLSMVRITSTESGDDRYMYTLPYLFFLCYLVIIHVRMKYADFVVLKTHIELEARIINENRGIFHRTVQWDWDFGLPTDHRDFHLEDPYLYRSESQIRVDHYIFTYRFHLILFIIVSFITSIFMSVYLTKLHTGMYPSSPNFVPLWITGGDLGTDWGILRDFTL